MVKHAEALDTAEALLDQAGYEISRRCTVRTSCFDLAARRKEKLVFIKVFPDIREVSPDDASEIRKISSCFSCTPLFISDLNDEETLRDDTVYLRYGVYVVTSKTFEDIVRGAFPLVEAAPGGYCVRVDGGKIRAGRYKLGLSIGKLAGMVGVSRRTLYGYERDMTRASVSAVYLLEKILGIPLVNAIDIFEAPPSSSNTADSSLGGCEDVRNGFLQSVLGKLTQFDLKVSPVSRAPFDFTAYCPHARFKIIGGVFKKKESRMKERIQEIVSLSKIVKAKPLLVGQEKIAAPREVAFLKCDDLANVEDRKELAALL